MNLQLKLAAVFFLASAISANAQKLPNVQKDGFRAPQTVKIDGKLAEWDDTFQAHNSATDISYTVANDDENLYLVIQAVDNTTINRCVGTGVTFNIQKSGKKNIKDRVSLTYPGFEGHATIIFNFLGRKGVVPDTSAAAKALVITNANKQIEQRAKGIKVIGIEGVDSLISVYNETGIKAQGAIDNRKIYSMELAVPLKYLKLSVASGDKFTYQLVVNGMINMFGPMTLTPSPTATPEQIARGQASMDKMAASMAQNSAPTDFWGEYTLVKK